jgi:multidrug efflux pump subunit AcrA (membrane-fusion protein)
MKFPVFPAILLPLALASCSRHADPASAAAPAPEAAPIQVVTSPADRQPVPRYLRVTGELKGSQEARVAADASGKVISAPIERGSVVKAGDVLFRLDDRSAVLSLAEAEASLVSAQLKLDLQRTELARNEPLARTKAISDSDFQRFKIDFASAEASYDAAKARRDMAQKTVTDATILSPFDGTVADHLRLVLNVPETSIGHVHPGLSVGFSVPAYPGTNFTGTVKYIGASVRNTARDLIVEAEVDNPDGKLKPGMFAEGRLALGEEDGVTVPASSVLTEGPVRRVFVLLKDHLEERLVEVGENKGEFVEIRRGVDRGEPVVLSPGPAAADGARAEQAVRQ